MKQLSTLRSLHMLLILIIVVSYAVPIVPTFVNQGRDGGVYAYVGKVVYDGGLPYRDAWDNKAPGIYYINALGFKLFGVTRWAIWLMEVIFASVMTLIFYQLLSEIYPQKRTVFVGTLLFVMMARHGGLVANGGMTESFALLPQVAFFWLGYRFIRQPTNLHAFLLGFVASGAFLIRQNAIGMALMFVPSLWMGGKLEWRSVRSWQGIGSMVLGGLCGLGIVVFLLRDALPEAYSAIVVSPAKLHQWQRQETVYPWTALYRTLKHSTGRYLFWPLAPLMGLGVVWLVRHWQKTNRAQSTFYLWVILTFVCDLYLINLTGQSYHHYYVTLIPASMLLVAIGYAHLRGKPRWMLSASWVYVGMMIAVLAVSQAHKYRPGDDNLGGPVIEHSLSTYVREHTAEDDTVLVWGIASYINFQSGRDSPTRYHYGYALIVPDYTEAEHIDEFLDDLNQQQPVMIVDRALGDGIRIPPLGAEDRAEWLEDGGRADTVDLSAIYSFVETHCNPIDFRDEARIYQCEYE